MKASPRNASHKSAPKSLLNIDHLPLPYVEMNARGIITRANCATLALHHPEQGQLIGKSAWDLLAIDEKDRSAAAFMSLMIAGGEPLPICRSIFDRSGKFRTYEIHRTIIRNSAGKPAGVRMIFMDVTERNIALEEMRHNCQWLESVMRSLSEAVVLTDVLGLVRSVNPAAEALLGFTASELEGKVIEETAPMLEYQSLTGAALDGRTAIETRCKGLATLRVHDGSRVKVEISTSPVFDKRTGSVSGIAAILRPMHDAA